MAISKGMAKGIADITFKNPMVTTYTPKRLSYYEHPIIVGFYDKNVIAYSFYLQYCEMYRYAISSFHAFKENEDNYYDIFYDKATKYIRSEKIKKIKEKNGL